MKKMLLGLMAAMMVLTGCGSKQSVGGLPEIDLTAKMFSSDKVGIADEIESIEYIPLELTDESLIANVLDACVSDEYIFIYSTRQESVLQFDRKGKFVCPIAKTGNGPGEVAQIISLTIDEENRLFCVNEYFSTSFYSFDGEFIKKITSLRPNSYQLSVGANTMAELGRMYVPMNIPGMFSLGIFNWATDDTIAFRRTIGNVDVMPLEEVSLKGWIYNGSMDGWFCYSDGIDTVWNVNAKAISPAFLIRHGYSAADEEEIRSSKTGNAAVDGKFSIFNIFETPRSYFVKCFKGSDQSNFFLYSLNKETGALCRETSLIDADELFGYNRALTGIGIRNETDGGLPIWPFFSFPAKKLMIQFNTAVEIEYLKEKYPDLSKHPVLQQVTEDSNPLVTIYHLR